MSVCLLERLFSSYSTSPPYSNTNACNYFQDKPYSKHKKTSQDVVLQQAHRQVLGDDERGQGQGQEAYRSVGNSGTPTSCLSCIAADASQTPIAALLRTVETVPVVTRTKATHRFSSSTVPAATTTAAANSSIRTEVLPRRLARLRSLSFRRGGRSSGMRMRSVGM